MAKFENDSGASHFRTTAWSVVTAAGDLDGESREESLAFLCKNYWKPIYYYIRRRGLSHDDATDITQEYFATFLEKNFVAAADRERGRFRTFVLVTVNRFLSKQLAKRRRREAKFNIVLPTGEGEEEILLPQLAVGETAEDDFNRRWALSLIENALTSMKEQCTEGRKLLYYETFALYLDSLGETKQISYRNMAERIGVTETDVTNFLHRGRNVFQKILRDEIRQLVTSESDIDAEIDALKEYLRK